VEELKTADLFLAGYTFPELGYAVLEAMCAGVPVAKFTEKPELEEIIDGFNGILAETDQEMIEKLTNYILNMGEMKKRLSTNARNTIVKRRCSSRTAIAWKIILRALTS
jgi:glycosyltransferase involved in cell wall biosynthesis